MKIDFWYGNTKRDVKRIDCFFYPNSGKYCGNMYDSNGKAIGDYSTNNSLDVEKEFSGIFSFE